LSEELFAFPAVRALLITQTGDALFVLDQLI
jgi:hypothetical protein